ncbi:MAG: hypothetical protein Q8S04_02440 [Bacteroidales bacterium]|nr:hypothetical protein [Bacteroidales bacterium]
MNTSFPLALCSFLESNSVEHSFSGNRITIMHPEVTIKVVSISEDGAKEIEANISLPNESKSAVYSVHKEKVITIYEDLWQTKNEVIKSRLLAILGRGEVIFARKCTVAAISADSASLFLENNHLLGSARCRYRYGLFYKKSLVAVATFSQARPMTRENGVLSSFEWVRYASLGSARVVGGMGRLMDYFVKMVEPQEIMTYADIDWSCGDVYKKLGFKFSELTKPIEFYVHKKNMTRVSLKKIRSDRKYRAPEFNQEDYTLVVNSGNLKFLRTFTIL